MQERFAAYFAAINGTNDWATIQPHFDDVFHDDCVFVTADGEFSKEQWADMASRLAGQGVSASNFQVTSEDGDSLEYKVTIKMSNDEHLHLTQKGTISGGQFVRIEPVDPSAMSRLVDSSGD